MHPNSSPEVSQRQTDSKAQCISAIGVWKHSLSECYRIQHDLKQRTREEISYNITQTSAAGEEATPGTETSRTSSCLERTDKGECVSPQCESMFVKNAHFCV